MRQDRFVRVMLVVIAILLAMNLVSHGTSFLASPAQAQITRVNPGPRVDVKAIKGYEVAGLTNIVALGDGKSFVVSAPGKFMVYQVETTQP
ncbi:MAG: hypothetical protein N2111_01520 [Candidatus Sumerlaeaceae bacterium]|nr:hypothetical protein [Candidatus Sumerlaeaceae bacterium]